MAESAILACRMSRCPVADWMKLGSAAGSTRAPSLSQCVTTAGGSPCGGWHRSSACCPASICCEYGGVSNSRRRSAKDNRVSPSGVMYVTRYNPKIKGKRLYGKRITIVKLKCAF